VIEVTSGATLLWRMSVDADVARRERNERLSLRIVGACFLALALYIASEAVVDLERKAAPERSVPGMRDKRISAFISRGFYWWDLSSIRPLGGGPIRQRR
jgi:hypothetical protein